MLRPDMNQRTRTLAGRARFCNPRRRPAPASKVLVESLRLDQRNADRKGIATKITKMHEKKALRCQAQILHWQTVWSATENLLFVTFCDSRGPHWNCRRIAHGLLAGPLCVARRGIKTCWTFALAGKPGKPPVAPALCRVATFATLHGQPVGLGVPPVPPITPVGPVLKRRSSAAGPAV
jgi:hypothetical protein